MKSTTILSLLLGTFAATGLAQEPAAPAEQTSPAIAPVEAGDGLEVPIGDFPVPTEMKKRQVKPGRLGKRHYGVFYCSYSLNNYCKQFLSQDGVGGLVGCESGTCYVGCGVSGYTRTNDVNDICVNYNTDTQNCGSDNNVCLAVANGTPVCSSGSCSATCNNGYTLSGGKCTNTNTDVNNCGSVGKTCPAVANGTPICSGGTCSATCTSPYTLSGGKCINLNNDVANCGTAGKTCPAVTNGTPVCSSGTCSATCANSYTLSNGACINTSNDLNNCGVAGKTCPAVANGTPICSSGSCSATCTSAYTLSGGKCVNLNNDVANCGTAGKTCPAVTNGTPLCSSGTCSATCANSYTLSNGACVNLNSDVNNCGTGGKTCPAVANGTPICSTGTCSATCTTGYTLTNGACTATCKDGSVLVNGACKRITGCTTNADCVSQTGSSTSYCYLSSDGNACFSGSSNSAGLPTGSACGWGTSLSGDDNSCATGLVCLNHVCSASTTNDPSNCGKANNVCPTPTNGSRSCQAGTCGISCNTGYTVSGSTCVNTNTDPNNCGTTGTKCSATGTGVASSTCVSGGCQVTCSTGYTLSSDKKSCSSTCADGSYLLGNTCVRYLCLTNAQCVSQTGRSDSACYLGLCFSSSTNSNGLPAGSQCGVSAVSGGDDNQCAAGLVCVYNTCYNANNPTACGAARTVCPIPANSVATCSIGTCGFTCKTGYTTNTAGTGCVLGASAKSKKKRGSVTPQLCPKGESACPITGSASFGAFVNSSDRVKDFAHSLGGYECIDTGSDLQSCGGCTSLGTGYDCTRIAHSAEVGCSNGKCVLFGCRKGYVPALDAETCVKVEETHKQRSAHLRQRASRKGISH